MAYLRRDERKQATTVAYLYKWTEKTTGKWYIGSRTAAGCHPNDGYICSSKVVKPLVESEPNNWYREVLVIGSPKYIAELEAAYLVTINAKSDEMSYNQHNGDGKFTTTGRVEPESSKVKRISKLKGKAKPEDFGLRISQIRTGIQFTEEWKANIGAASKGRIQTAEARKKNSDAHIGDKNAFFGKTHSETTKIKCGAANKGKAARKWTGFWCAPNGNKYITLKQAARDYPISTNTIRVWCKANKHGWSFEQGDKNDT